tara:strand:+ start:1555 stop:2385 length:831 start_codon:yes stop_codon:yes gene_type:complete
MNRVHNKKRNIGIIYDQIINFTCSNILEENNSRAEDALNIIKKHFKNSDQLKKEYKLFKALATTRGVSDQLAYSIINEAKKACNEMFNREKLEKEKSLLIKDLNYTFGKGKIFEEKVKNYRVYATIQTLLNEWRSNNSNFDLSTEYEIKLHQYLISKNNLNESLKPLPKVDKLTYNIMKEMFDKKYNLILTENQQKLITLFINEDDDQLIKEFKIIKAESISKLNKYFIKCNNSILLEKKKKIFSKISNLSEDLTNRNNIEKYLTIIKLTNEISGE